LNDLINNSSGFNENEKKLLFKTINEIFFTEEDNFFSEIFSNLEDTSSLDKLKLESITLAPSFFFESRRDVKKFYNELYLNVKILKKLGDIDLKDYLLLKLLLFKYKWLHKYFSSKSISFWLGNENILKFTAENLEKLNIENSIGRLDQTIIFSVFKMLFPSFETNNTSTKINQRRYFPTYFSNNIFNEAFSRTDLIKAIEENKIEDLIKNKVIGKDNEQKFKNDIKDFIIKSENISTIEEYKQVINLVKKGYFNLLDTREIAGFINHGENTFAKDYKSLLDTKIFTNSPDAFGAFLIELNNHYSIYPKGISLNNGIDLEGFFNNNKIENFKLLDKKFVKKLLVQILKKEIIDNDKQPIKAMGVIRNGNEYIVSGSDFNMIYKEFQNILKEYFSNNFESVFLKKSPDDTLRSLDLLTIAKIFESPSERKKNIKAIEGLKALDMKWGTNIINTKNYLSKGWDIFIKYVERNRIKIMPEAIENYEIFLDYLYAYRFSKYQQIPDEDDVKLFQNRSKTVSKILDKNKSNK
jgi:hypothetical protein